MVLVEWWLEHPWELMVAALFVVSFTVYLWIAIFIFWDD